MSCDLHIQLTYTMGLNSISLERPLAKCDESRSSISLQAPRIVFNIILSIVTRNNIVKNVISCDYVLSEVSPFQLLMCSEMPPAFDFSFKNLFYVQVHLPEFGNQVLMVWHNSVLVESILWRLPLLKMDIGLTFCRGLPGSFFLVTAAFG